jgi:hypothetical protein
MKMAFYITKCSISTTERPNQSPEPTSIAAFGESVTSVARLVSGSGWLSFGR